MGLISEDAFLLCRMAGSEPIDPHMVSEKTSKNLRKKLGVVDSSSDTAWLPGACSSQVRSSNVPHVGPVTCLHTIMQLKNRFL